MSISSHSRLYWRDADRRKEILFWNVVKSEYRRVLSLFLLHYDDFSESLVHLFCKFWNADSHIKLPTDFVICLCYYFPCSSPLAHYAEFSYLKNGFLDLCGDVQCDTWVMFWGPLERLQHSCRTLSSLLQDLCLYSCIIYQSQNWHTAEFQWLESLVLLSWLLNSKQWPGLDSVPWKSKFMSENRKRLSKSALCAPLSEDSLTGFPVILNCSSHPIIWTWSK